MGHSLAVLVVGLLIIVMRLAMPEWLAQSLELMVAFMLIGLGILAILGVTETLYKRWLPDRVHAHVHRHGEDSHTHTHAHWNWNPNPHSALSHLAVSLGLYGVLRPLVVGIVHGLAGGGAVALMVLYTLPSTPTRLAYLIIFGLGTVAGMSLVTTMMSLPLVVARGRIARLTRVLTLGSGALSVGLGVWMAHRVATGAG
jgi:high-affinity nickel-transport protein